MTDVLLSGIAGFLGSHMCDYLLTHTDWNIIGITRLGHSGNLNRLAQMPSWQTEGSRVQLVHHDLRSPISAQLAKQIGPVDIILHIGASTHVDRSIADPISFVMDNVVGTAHLLEFARQCDRLRWFYYQSTDEVFGPAALPKGPMSGFSGQYRDFPYQLEEYFEWDRYHTSNVYSATKAGGEELCLAYHVTYKLPVLICHTMNLIGIFQHPEKFLPSTVAKVQRGEEVQIHAYPDLQRAGSRFYIDAGHVADAIHFLLQHGDAGDKYNVVGEREVDNLELAERISQILGLPLTFRLVDAHSQRPGHDPRYALSGGKLAAMGWKPPTSFDQSLERTVRWYRDHPGWL